MQHLPRTERNAESLVTNSRNADFCVLTCPCDPAGNCGLQFGHQVWQERTGVHQQQVPGRRNGQGVSILSGRESQSGINLGGPVKSSQHARHLLHKSWQQRRKLNMRPS